MKNILISGGCGFVGRNMVKRLAQDPNNRILFIDDLSVGEHPDVWLKKEKKMQEGNICTYCSDGRLIFIENDFRQVLFNLNSDSEFLKKEYNLDFKKFNDVFHFAAIVGGRAMIDGDPIMVALDLSIDSEFFYWISRHKPDRVLYPSSSAAYPVDLQTDGGAIALSETDIDFKQMGQPDMTYGWTKLTGEFLAQITAKHYGVSIACIRPFSGYGEDQNLTYPIPAIAKRAALKEAALIKAQNDSTAVSNKLRKQVTHDGKSPLSQRQADLITTLANKTARRSLGYKRTKGVKSVTQSEAIAAFPKQPNVPSTRGGNFSKEDIDG